MGFKSQARNTWKDQFKILHFSFNQKLKNKTRFKFYFNNLYFIKYIIYYEDFN